MINLKKFLFRNIGILSVTILGSVLRLYHLGAHSLWKDEIFSAIEAKKPILTLITTKSYDYYGYAPVHYIFTHIAQYFGDGDFITRLPSAIFGIITIPIVYLIGKSIYDKNVGILSALLFSLSITHIQFSQEVRYYPYLLFFCSLTILSTYNLMIKPQKLKWLLLLAISTLLNVATQATATLILAAEFLFLLVIIVLHHQLIRQALRTRLKNKPSLILVSVVTIVLVITMGLTIHFISSFKDLFLMIVFKPAMPVGDYVRLISTSLSGGTYLLYFYVILGLLGVYSGFRHNRQGPFLLILTFFVTPLVLYYFRPGLNHDFNIRYILPMLIPQFIFVSLGINYIARNVALKILFVLLIIVLTIRPLLTSYAQTKGDWRGVAQYISTNAKPGDVIIPDGDYNVMLLDYYLNSNKNGFITKKTNQALSPETIPFRVYYLQHDYQKPDGKPNPDALPIDDYEKTISFMAKISPLHLFVSRPIYYWHEAEEGWLSNNGWTVSDFWGQKVMSNDTMAVDNATVSYPIEIPKNARYTLYANLRWDGARSVIKYKIDNGDWSSGFLPFYGEKGDVIKQWKMKEAVLGSFDLTRGKHTITFLSQTNPDKTDRYQTIDYFYLTK